MKKPYTKLMHKLTGGRLGQEAQQKDEDTVAKVHHAQAAELLQVQGFQHGTQPAQPAFVGAGFVAAGANEAAAAPSAEDIGGLINAFPSCVPSASSSSLGSMEQWNADGGTSIIFVTFVPAILHDQGASICARARVLAPTASSSTSGGGAQGPDLGVRMSRVPLEADGMSADTHEHPSSWDLWVSTDRLVVPSGCRIEFWHEWRVNPETITALQLEAQQRQQQQRIAGTITLCNRTRRSAIMPGPQKLKSPQSVSP